MMYDPSGHDWIENLSKGLMTALVVAAITTIVVATGGTAASVLVPVGISLASTLYSDYKDDGKINGDIDSYCGAAIGTAIGSLGGNLVGDMIFSGAGDLVGDLMSGNIENGLDGVITFLSGAGLGAVGNVISKTGDFISKKKIDAVVGNWNKSNSVINDNLKNAGLGDFKIGKLGRQGLYDEFGKKFGFDQMQKELKYIYDSFLATI